MSNVSNNGSSSMTRIKELEAQAEQFQSEQKLSECLNAYEEVLHLKKEEFGQESEHYLSTSHKLAEICNVVAMIFLNKDKPESCLEFLRRAEGLAAGSSLYKAITFNNMAQYCKKTNKLKTAVQYLEKAYEIQIKQGNPVLLADMHLNMCALLSQQDKHNEALEHILVALVLLQDEYGSYLLSQLQGQKNDQVNINSAIKQNESNQYTNTIGESETGEQSQDLFSKLAIAYHNLGVEFEFLKRFEESLQTYEKSVNFARSNLGPQHDLTKMFENVFTQAQNTIQNSRQKDVLKKKQMKSLKGIPASQVYSNIQQQHQQQPKRTPAYPNSTNTATKTLPSTSKTKLNSKEVISSSSSPFQNNQSQLKNNSVNRQNSQDQNIQQSSSSSSSQNEKNSKVGNDGHHTDKIRNEITENNVLKTSQK